MDLTDDQKEKEIDDIIEREMAGLSDELTKEESRRLKEAVREKVEREVGREFARLKSEKEKKEKKEKKGKQKKAGKSRKTEEEYFLRFNRNFRFQHMILFSSVIILVFSGLPLKFPDFFISHFLMKFWGGIQNSRFFHRVGASMLIYFIVHHFFYTLLSRDGRRDFVKLLPLPKDLKDLALNIRHFVGKNPERPRFDRFSYIEKFDYWAVYWGCIVMIASGLILWFEGFAMKVLPKYWLDIAHEAHSDEALLATLAVVIWHFYNVHFNPDRFPGTLLWWHGKISKKEMIEEHPLEYERMMRDREGKEDREQSEGGEK